MPLLIVFLCIISICIGAGFTYLKLRPKLKYVKQQYEEEKQYHNDLLRQIDDCKTTVNTLDTQIKEKKNTLTTLSDQAKQAADIFYNQNMELVSTNFDIATEQMAQEFQEFKESAQAEYLALLEDCSQNLRQELHDKQEELKALTIKLDDLKTKIAVVVDERKRAIEQEEQKDFYRLALSQSDANEISKIKEIIPYLRDPEPLNKVIWKVYYEKLYTDLIGRVLGSGVKTGIYKITNIQDGRCYIGQAVNVADRWKQHIKRGLGAETPTRNKLYPAMMQIGVENFYFELLEECPREKLDKQEDYWQDFYKAKEFGYSIK